MSTLTDLRSALASAADPEHAANLALTEVRDLLDDVEHEHRLAALVIAVNGYRRALTPRSTDPSLRGDLHTLYLDAVMAGCVDNWDLVDVSAETVLGGSGRGGARRPPRPGPEGHGMDAP